MRRSTFLLAGAALALASLSGCGGSDNAYSADHNGGGTPPPAGGVGLANAPWARFHQGNQSRGVGMGDDFQGDGVAAWTAPYSGGREFAGGAVIDTDGTLFVNDSGQAQVYALNRADGSRKWSFSLQDAGTGAFSGPGAIGANGLVFFGLNAETGVMVALNKANGTQRWRSSVTGVDEQTPISSSPVITPGNTLIFVAGRYLVGLDADTGVARWRESLLSSPDGVHPALSPDGNTVYVAEGEGGVYAFDSRTGQERWRFSTGIPAPTSSVSVDSDGNLYVACGNRVVSLTSAPSIRWNRAVPGGTSTLLVENTPAIYRPQPLAGLQPAGRQVTTNFAVAFGDNTGQVHAWRAATGEPIWEPAALGGNVGVGSIAVDAGGDLYVGASDGNLYALEGNTGLERWRFAVGSGAILTRSHPAIDEQGWIFIGSDRFYGVRQRQPV